MTNEDFPLVIFLLSQFLSIYSQEDEEQNGKAPKRTTTITEERQRNTDYRRQSQHHSYINKQVEQENTQHAIAVYSSELERLSLCQVYQSQYQRQEEQQNRNPSSSPTVQKMKSVSCSGTNLSLVWVPFRNPLPCKPPEPMAISL